MFRTSLAGRLDQRMTPVLAQPALQIEVVVLLAPQHSRQCLAMHATLIFAKRFGCDPLVELVGVGDAALHDLVEIAERVLQVSGRQTQLDNLAAAARNVEHIVRRRLCSDLGRIDRIATFTDDVGVERVLGVGRCVGLVPQPLRIALVFGEQQFRFARAMKRVRAEIRMRGLDDAVSGVTQRRLAIVFSPRPRVAEPKRRQDPQASRFSPAVVDGNADQYVVRALLRVFDENVEVTVILKDAGVEQFVFELLARALRVLLEQLCVRKFVLRVLVQILHVRVRWRAIDVEVVLLHIFAVVALAVGEAEQALLQDRVTFVPQCQRKT